MPNWCTNVISIKGPKDTIKSLWDKAQKSEGFLSAMRPEPNYEQTQVDQTYPDISGNKPVDPEQSWWHWRVQNWGTKWDVDTNWLKYSESGGTAELKGYFESAWSPPIDAFRYYGDENHDVDLSIMYHEPGMAFVGKWTADGDDECTTYSEYTSDTVRDAIGEELDDCFNISEELSYYEQEESEEG